MNGIALKPGAYDHEFVETRVVVMLQELLAAIAVAAIGDETLTEAEHALACFLTFYRQIDQCVDEVPQASRLKGKHRTVKRLMRSMLSKMKDMGLAEEHDAGGVSEASAADFAQLAIDFIETTHKVMLDSTRQYARDAMVKGFQNG